MTLPQIAAQLTEAPSHPALEQAIADLDAAAGQKDKGAALKVVSKNIAICRKELDLNPGLFEAA